MKVKKYRYFSADFETTVYSGQEFTEVWASAIVELYTEDVHIFNSIDELYYYLKGLKTNCVVYFHNLKFDGSFWLSFLITKLHMKQAYYQQGDDTTSIVWKKDKEMCNNEFKYSISDKGQWYSIIIKTGNHFIEIRDSLKLLPFSVKRIGKSFQTKHKKLDMEYTGFRYAGCPITDKEREYIANDVLVVKEALEIMFNDGNNKLTIGSCCLEEFKSKYSKWEYNTTFPDLYQEEIDYEKYSFLNAGEYVRKSYRGGWCYLVKGKENKIFTKGTTADVNSLYPSMMSSESGNYYPIGKPSFWKGNFIPNEAIGIDRYYFIRIKTRFKIKDGFLPFIQIKDNYIYKGTESLTTSDYYNEKTKKYSRYYKDLSGKNHDTRVTLTMTMIDYILFREHYDVVDFEILDGCWFYAIIGLFDEYIDKYKKIKVVSTGAKRELAKLFLNNLYGKMASSKDSSFKVAFEKEDGSIGFLSVSANDKQAGYIPIGSAITSYARNFTIRAAQKNYHGINKRGFIYADTDSIHCDLEPDKIVGIKVHKSDFCCWKLESCWDEAIFTRQKTYIEHITHEDCEEIENPYYNVKCAGMPDRCKDLFIKSLTGDYKKEGVFENETFKREWYEPEKEFLFKENGDKNLRKLTDFKVGLKIYGKLMPVRIKGGTLLVETTYEMR